MLGKRASFAQSRTTIAERFGAEELLAQFRRVLAGELDYRKEARNLLRFRELTAGHDRILVPEPVAQLTSSRVLTMDFVPGRKVAARQRDQHRPPRDPVHPAGACLPTPLVRRAGARHPTAYPGGVWYWVFKFLVIGPAAIAVHRPLWRGRENLPRSGAFILAANHLAGNDPGYVSLGVPRKVVFVAKRKYYELPGLRGRITAWFLRAIGQNQVDPTSATTAAPALEAARQLLEAGGVWAVFPEGTRSPDGRLYRGRTGLMRVALATGVPVLPVSITGTRHPRRRFSRAPGTERITVTYGPPMDLSRWAGRGVDPVAWREATDALMGQLARMTGQEYVDAYAVRPAPGDPGT